MNIKKYKILIVDDNKNNIRAITYILNREGYKVISSQDAQTVIPIARKVNPALIILDIMMPLKDGYEICHDLKKEPGLYNTPVIFLSARVQDKNKKKWRRLGVKAFITKPFRVADIKDTVAKALNRKNEKYSGNRRRQKYP